MFDHRRREWIAFSKIWKQYRKSSNNSFKEIFHYIEHDNSSDSFPSYSKIKTNDESFTYKNKKNKSYKELVHKLKLNGFLFNPIKKVLKQFDTIKNLSYEQTDVITYNKEKERKKKYENLKIIILSVVYYSLIKNQCRYLIFIVSFDLSYSFYFFYSQCLFLNISQFHPSESYRD